MKARVRLAVLKILLLKEEFSEKELSEAVSIITEKKEEELLKWLAQDNGRRDRKKSASPKRIDEQKSKVVLAIKDSEPERYTILNKMDELMRKGVLLPKMQDFRRVGAEISKNYDAGKYRKEAISRLMEILVKEPMDRLEDLDKKLMDQAENTGQKQDEYQNLAAFLIHGKPNSKHNRDSSHL